MYFYKIPCYARMLYILKYVNNIILGVSWDAHQVIFTHSLGLVDPTYQNK